MNDSEDDIRQAGYRTGWRVLTIAGGSCFASAKKLLPIFGWAEGVVPFGQSGMSRDAQPAHFIIGDVHPLRVVL